MRAALDVAEHYGDGRRKRREIAAATGIHAGYLSPVLAALVRHGVLVAFAGKHGGYELRRPPEATTLLALVDVVGAGRVQAHEADDDEPPTAPVHIAWADAQQAFRDRLARTTLADLCLAAASPDAALEAAEPRLGAQDEQPAAVRRRRTTTRRLGYIRWRSSLRQQRAASTGNAR